MLFIMTLVHKNNEEKFMIINFFAWKDTKFLIMFWFYKYIFRSFIFFLFFKLYYININATKVIIVKH